MVTRPILDWNSGCDNAFWKVFDIACSGLRTIWVYIPRRIWLIISCFRRLLSVLRIQGLLWLSLLIFFSYSSPNLFNGVSWMVIFSINTENEWRIKLLPNFVRAIKKISPFPYTKRLIVRICSKYRNRSISGLIFWNIRFRQASITEYWLGILSSPVN